jgi:hypothetical protein
MIDTSLTSTLFQSHLPISKIISKYRRRNPKIVTGDCIQTGELLSNPSLIEFETAFAANEQTPILYLKNRKIFFLRFNIIKY